MWTTKTQRDNFTRYDKRLDTISTVSGLFASVNYNGLTFLFYNAMILIWIIYAL